MVFSLREPCSSSGLRVGSGAGALVDRRWTYGAAGLLAFQVVQALLAAGKPDVYFDSYWFGSYSHGLVRRGLGGEAVKLLTGGALDRGVTQTLQWTITGFLAALLVFLILRAVRSPRVEIRVLGLVAAGSPFTVEFVMTQRRPDQIGAIVFVVLACYLGWWRAKHPLSAAALAGVALSIGVLVHEGTALVIAPWIGVAISLWVARAYESRWRVGAAMGGLAVFLPLAVSLMVGLARPDEGAAMAIQAEALEAGLPNVAGLFHLTDGIQDALNFVHERVPMLVKGSVPVLTLVSGLTFLLVPRLGIRSHPRAAAPASAVLAGATVVLFATGFDWVRWGCWFGLGLFVTLLVFADSHPNATEDEAGGISWMERNLPNVARQRGRLSPLPGVGALVYLVMLAPLPALVPPGEVVNLLFAVSAR